MPIIAGQLGMILMGFFDTIQIGVLGSDYIAATGLSNSVYWLFTLLGMGVLFAISPLVSEAFGEKNSWKAIAVFRSGIRVAMLLSVLTTIVLYLALNFFPLLGQSDNINQISLRYLRILNLSTPLMFFFAAGRQLLDGSGKTWVGMVVNLAGLCSNVVLNWLLIKGNCGFPALGIEGASIATSTSRLLMTIIVFIYIAVDPSVKKLREEYSSRNEVLHFDKKILILGFPYALQMFWEIGAFSVAQTMSGWISESALASHQIAINLASITFMAVTGLSAAGTITVGYAYGARNRQAMIMAAKSIITLCIVIELIFAVVFLLAKDFLPTLYTTDKAVIETASVLLVFAAFFQVSDGLQSIATGLARGIQDTRIPSVLAFVSYWLVMIPSCYWLAFKVGWGINGIWMGSIIGLSVASVFLLLRFGWKVRKVKFTEL